MQPLLLYRPRRYRYPGRLPRNDRAALAGIVYGSGLGRTRWVVERTFAWPHQFKRLRIRYEVRADLHLGLMQLACALICYWQLSTS